MFGFKTILNVDSGRVKSIDFHEKEPLVLGSCYDGSISVWNFETSEQVYSHAGDLGRPVRSAKFIRNKPWIVTGNDNGVVRVLDYISKKQIVLFLAHGNYIRCVAIHPTMPYLFTASDDMKIKVWDWERNWEKVATLKGHSHYVMQIAFDSLNPDLVFSASLDKTVRVWSIDKRETVLKLKGHHLGVTCLSSFSNLEDSFLVSGSDDGLVKIWKVKTGTCIQTHEEHLNNVTGVMFAFGIVQSVSEDETWRAWISLPWCPGSSKEPKRGRLWGLCNSDVHKVIGIACESGMFVMKSDS